MKIYLAAIVIGSMLASTTGADEPAPGARPAADWADEHPLGCVDCHVEGAAGRLDRLLDEIGHPGLGPEIALVPGDCRECHVPDDTGDAPPLGPLVHQAHFRAPETNAFMEAHAGDCRVCHVVDPVTGEATPKGGPANW